MCPCGDTLFGSGSNQMLCKDCVKEMVTSEIHAKSNIAVLGIMNTPNRLITGEKIGALHLASQLCPSIDQNHLQD